MSTIYDSSVQPIRFLLDGAVHQVVGLPATRTVLQYLREDLNRTGTKEGCGEGDCGACTVVVGEAVLVYGQHRLRARAVNSCIQFVPTLDGKALYTVESLKRNRGAPPSSSTLHPVQQAMVDCHGSQCGFCTPGFVMSLVALYKTESSPTKQSIDDALAGNLCRCTGYRPIVAAARKMVELGRVPSAAIDWLSAPAGSAVTADEAALLARLAGLQRTGGVQFSHPQGNFYAPRTIAEFAALRQRLPNARIVAGSTDVGLWVTKQHRELGDVLYTGCVTELAQIKVTDDVIDIGAAVTVTDAMPVLAREYVDFDELFRRYGSPPIRNAATIGGNVANGSPIGDSMPGLIALAAQVVLRCGATLRQLPLEDFYLDYQKTALGAGEFIERLLMPRARGGQHFRTYKISKRFDQDISALCAAFAIELVDATVTSARIAFGGMAAIPKRARRTEAALVGKPWDEATVRTAMPALAHDYAPIADMRASAAYRREVAANLLLKFFVETTSGVSTRLYLTGSVAA